MTVPELSSKERSLFTQVVKHYENKQPKKGTVPRVSEDMRFSADRTYRPQDSRSTAQETPGPWRHHCHEGAHHQQSGQFR